MTSTTEPSEVRPRSGGDSEPSGSTRAGRATTRPWWKHPWLALFTLIVLAWLAMFVVPSYITLDPDRVPIELDQNVTVHYPFIVFHVVTGAIALIAGLLQIWSWLRVNHPRAHRIIGRLYVFAGVFPATLSAAVLVVIRVQESGTYGNSITIGNSLWAILWFGTTAGAYWAARQRRYADHRRLMIYSFALTTGILWTRPMFIATLVVPGFKFEYFLENTGWLPWVMHLLIAQWWLNRTARRPLVMAGKR